MEMDRQGRGKRARRQGRSAELLVQKLFDDWEWDARIEVPDEGYDLNVEVPCGAESPAHRFLVQVKSSGEFTARSDGSWSVPLKRSRLQEYRRHRLPVFIIGVDLATDSFRWCAADDDRSVVPPRLRASSKSRTKKKSPEVYLRLVEEQTLSKSRDAALVSAIDCAWRRRDDLFHPPVIAARTREILLQKKDPRLNVTVNVIGGVETRIIHARDAPVCLSAEIRFASLAEAESFRDSYRFGVPATVRTHELKITGSALFEELPASGQLSVTREAQRGRLLFGYVDGEVGAEVQWVIDEDGERFVGNDGGEWQLKCPQLPLRIRIRVNLLDGQLIFSFSLERDVWNGYDICRLPYFDAFLQLMRGVLKCGAIAMAMREQGKVRQIADVPIKGERPLLQSILNWLEYIAALRKICHWSSRQVAWNEHSMLDEDEMRNWALGASLIEGEMPDAGPTKFTFFYPDAMLLTIGSANGKFVLRTALDIRCGSEHVTDIPVLITLSDYHFSIGEAPNECLIERRSGSKAVMQLDSSPDDEISESLFVA